MTKESKSRIQRYCGNVVIMIPLIFMVCVCLIPFFVMISSSFSSNDVVKAGVVLFPKEPTFLAYKYLFSMPQDILKSYGVTIIITLLGTVVNIFLCSLIAYPLSDPEFKYRKAITFFVFFTMLFQVGLIPQYIVITRLFHLNDTIWILIIMPLCSPGHILLLKVYFGSLDKTMFESARMDGANELRILFQVAVPLIKPGLITCIFQFVIMYWNDAYTSLYYADTITPIALYIQRWQQYVQDLAVKASAGQLPFVSGTADVPEKTVQFALGVITTIPLITIFLVFQKYYVRGLTAGAVKG
ncbi:MAG: carbohydrate ABC transporter permease [Clostridia bacterium]|nr:carbohydrate ABC transporter permease [Clostridia bacterium]